MDSSCDIIIFITKCFYFKKALSTIFADIKIVTMFIKIILEDSKTVKGIRNFGPKCNLCLYFII